MQLDSRNHGESGGKARCSVLPGALHAQRAGPRGQTRQAGGSAFIASAFVQDAPQAAHEQWRKVADQLRPTVPKLAALMDTAGNDVLAYMTFPAMHRPKLHSTNPIGRLNHEIKRCPEVVGIFPNEAATRRLVDAVLLEQNDEWSVQRARSMPRDTMAELLDLPASLPAMAN